jgi:lipopolysaccharide transport system ATP-binding protein
MAQVAIRVEHLSKQYRIGAGRPSYRTFREALIEGVTAPVRHLRGLSANGEGQTIWALRDVSFEVKQGEVLGIIGRNGAGKSTLLKILSRITEPTEGRAELDGRVGSLLEVGTGFHAELSGRENIYLNGAILGMKRSEIQRKFDEIVAFAEIEQFIDTPVKHYSSGMYMRLAFAVAAHLDPDILLVDEVLAVGDTAFQRKCLGKMGSVAMQGRTVLFVSHSMRAVTDLCRKCLWIDEGKIVQEGAPQEVVLAYLSSGKPERSDGIITSDMHINATGDVYFRRVTLLDKTGHPVTTFFFGDSLCMLLEFEVSHPVEGMRLIVAIEKLDGTLVSVFHHTDDPREQPIDAEPGTYVALMQVDLPLMPGGYTLHLGAKPAPGYWGFGRSWDWVQRAIDFYCEEFTCDGQAVLPSGGVVRPTAKWEICRGEFPQA